MAAIEEALFYASQILQSKAIQMKAVRSLCRYVFFLTYIMALFFVLYTDFLTVSEWFKVHG